MCVCACAAMCVYCVFIFLRVGNSVHRRFRFTAAVFAAETQRGGREKVKASITRVYNIMRVYTQCMRTPIMSSERERANGRGKIIHIIQNLRNPARRSLYYHPDIIHCSSSSSNTYNARDWGATCGSVFDYSASTIFFPDNSNNNNNNNTFYTNDAAVRRRRFVYPTATSLDSLAPAPPPPSTRRLLLQHRLRLVHTRRVYYNNNIILCMYTTIIIIIIIRTAAARLLPR